MQNAEIEILNKDCTFVNLDGENYAVSRFLIDDELAEIQKEIDQIAIDIIPFDKADAVFVFCNTLIGILLDTFLSDPANPHSLANALNNSKSGIGKWCNSIHESINHRNNPMDYQGGFTKSGDVVTYGSGIHKDISYGGGDHRVRTYDHDILRFWHAIKDYHDGVFRDGGYVDGQFVEVISNVSSRGIEFSQLSWKDAIVKYCCHMFADFFSSRGLPCPGASFLSHADNRQLRKFASDTYGGGLNMRTQGLQVASFVIMDLITKAYVRLRYVDEKASYSEEAITNKIHLLQLYTNGLVTAFNIGKVIITEEPQRLNLPVIVHTVRLVGTCVKDKIEYNQRVITKVSLDAVKTQLVGYKAFLIVGENICYETKSQEKMQYILDDLNKKIAQREEATNRLVHLLQNNDICIQDESEDIYENMSTLVETINVELDSQEDLSKLVDTTLIKDYSEEYPSDYSRVYCEVYSKL